MYTPAVKASLALPEREATFEQIGYPFAGSVQNVVSGAANGGTTAGFIYVRTLPYAADPSFKTFTLEAGDNQQAYRMEYAFCEQWGISGVFDESLKVTQTWRGRQKAKHAFTAGLTPPDVEDILFNTGKIYCDAVGGTLWRHAADQHLAGLRHHRQARPEGAAGRRRAALLLVREGRQT